MAVEKKIAWSRREMLESCVAYGSVAAVTATGGRVDAAVVTQSAEQPAPPSTGGPLADAASHGNRVMQALQQTSEQFASVRALELDERVEPAFVFQATDQDACG